MAEAVPGRTGTLSYLFTTSHGILKRTVDVLTKGPQRSDAPAEENADWAWVQYGRFAMNGFRLTHRLAGSGANPLKFLRATTTPDEMPKVHIQGREGVVLNTFLEAQLRGLTGNTDTFPAGLTPQKFYRVGRALEVFHHSLATLSVLNGRGSVRLRDFNTDNFEGVREGVMDATTNWQRNYTGEGIWDILRGLDHTVRLVLLSPGLITTPTDYYHVYEAACFFAAGRQLLTQPANGESEREMVKRMFGKRGKS